VRKYIVSFLVFFFCHISFGFTQSKPNEIFIGVPETNNNTNAIIRYSNTTYHLKSTNHLNVLHDYAITIVDNGGKGYANIVIPYDLHSKVSNISVSIYDQYGQKIESAKTNDFNDISYTSSHLFDDLRLKYYKGLQKKYICKIQKSLYRFFPYASMATSMGRRYLGNQS